MIHATGKPPSPLPRSFNRSTGELSIKGTGFNDAYWGEQTRGLIKLIVKELLPDSYDKIFTRARDMAKKTRGAARAEEVIDLTNDDPPEEFAMLVDLPTDDEEDIEMVVVKNEPVEGNVGLSNNDSDGEVVAETEASEDEDEDEDVWDGYEDGNEVIYEDDEVEEQDDGDDEDGEQYDEDE